MLFQIPDGIMFDRGLGAAEKLYWACMAACVEPDFGESESTVKRRIKALREAGLYPVKPLEPVKEIAPDVDPVEESAKDSAVDADVLALFDAMMEPPRRVGKRARSWIGALIDVYGKQTVLNSCRLIVLSRECPYCVMRELVDDVGRLCEERGNLLQYPNELTGAERSRVLEAFHILNVSHGIQKYARVRLLLLGQQYGAAAVVDACKRALPFNPTWRDDVGILPCARVELVRRILAGEPLEGGV